MKKFSALTLFTLSVFFAGCSADDFKASMSDEKISEQEKYIPEEPDYSEFFKEKDLDDEIDERELMKPARIDMGV